MKNGFKVKKRVRTILADQNFGTTAENTEDCYENEDRCSEHGES